jgi:hypothetical protein
LSFFIFFFSIKVKQGVGSFNEPIILASAITDQNGYFQFSYELDEIESGSADLIRPNNQGFVTLIENIELKKDKNLTLYAQNQSTMILSLTGNRAWSAQDTLYYHISYNNQDFFKVQPSIGPLDTFYISVPNLENTGAFTWLNYGIGRQDFMRSKIASTIQDSTYQNIGLLLEGCSALEQVEIAIE